MNYLVEKTEDFDIINNALHDQNFNIDELSFYNETIKIRIKKKNKKNAQLVKSFIFFKLVKIPVNEFILSVYNATGFEINDTEKIGIYGFNYLDFIPSENKIIINTIPSIRFIINISKLKINLEESKRVRNWKMKVVFSRRWTSKQTF